MFNHRTESRWGRTIALLASAGLLLGACGGSSGGKSSTSGIPSGDIKIGALLTLTGPFAAIGTAQKTNDETLVTLLNQNGGIAGHQVQLIILNDQGDPSNAVAQAGKLISDKVAGVIYAGTAATVEQTIPVFMKNKVPVVMLDPLDQWDNAAKYPYMFDNYPLNQPTTNVMVQFAQSTLHVTKLGVIGDSTTFADALETDLKKSATQSGLQIAKTVAYTSQSTDVTTQVRQLKAAGANGIALLSEAGMGHVYDALRTVGWKPPIITTAASYFDGFTSLKNLAATTFSNCAIAIHKGQQPDAATTAVLTTVTKKTGVNPSVGQLVLTNDDLLILKSAIEKANSVDPAKIKAQIESVSGQGFTSPAFSYTFSADHHGGWPQSEIHMCDMSPLGPFDLPYFAGS